MGILLDRSFELIIAILATAKAGGACLPIDTQYPGKRIQAMLKDSEASVLLTTDKVLRQLSFTSLARTFLNHVKKQDCQKKVDSFTQQEINELKHSKHYKYVEVMM